MHEIRITLFQLSDIDDQSAFDIELDDKILKAGLKPILSRHKISGAYPPPHSCDESVKKVGDDVVAAIKTYEATLSERAYLKSEVDYGCTKKRMGIFSITREIIKNSMDEEKETAQLLKRNLFPISQSSKLDIFRGTLL